MIFQMEQIRADIREFSQSSGVDKVIVLWTANTERFCDIVPGVNDTANNLLAAIQVRALRSALHLYISYRRISWLPAVSTLENLQCQKYEGINQLWLIIQ